MGQALKSQGQSLQAYRSAATSSFSEHKTGANRTVEGPQDMMGIVVQLDVGPQGA